MPGERWAVATVHAFEGDLPRHPCPRQSYRDEPYSHNCIPSLRQGIRITTGGIGHELALALAGDRHFAADVVANLPEVLERLLDVPSALIQRHGAISPEVAAAMARGVRRRNGTDLGLAVAGAERLPGGNETVAYIALAQDGDAIATGEYRHVSSMRFAG